MTPKVDSHHHDEHAVPSRTRRRILRRRSRITTMGGSSLLVKETRHYGEQDRGTSRGDRRIIMKETGEDLTWKALAWHDLRATGITWMAIRGDDPLHIQHRAGHTSFATTQRYIRQAEAVRPGIGSAAAVARTNLAGPGPRISRGANPMSCHSFLGSLSKMTSAMSSHSGARPRGQLRVFRTFGETFSCPRRFRRAARCTQLTKSKNR
jgi:Phage integrase family